MSRRMSVSLTLDAVQARTKTVTRRHAASWTSLEPGDRLTLIEKGMGLPKGAQQVVVAEVEVVDVRVEPLHLVDEHEIELEGLGAMDVVDFRDFWLSTHGYNPRTQVEFMRIECRRIEWRYLDEAPA